MGHLSNWYYHLTVFKINKCLVFMTIDSSLALFFMISVSRLLIILEILVLSKKLSLRFSGFFDKVNNISLHLSAYLQFLRILIWDMDLEFGSWSLECGFEF